MDGELTLNACLMAVWRRQPREAVNLHSDQGSQFTSHNRRALIKMRKLMGIMPLTSSDFSLISKAFVLDYARNFSLCQLIDPALKC